MLPGVDVEEKHANKVELIKVYDKLLITLGGCMMLIIPRMEYFFFLCAIHLYLKRRATNFTII